MSKIKIGCKRKEPRLSITHKKAHELERARIKAKTPKIILVNRKRKILSPPKPRLPLRKVSEKQAKRLIELFKLTSILKNAVSNKERYSPLYKSELSGKWFSSVDPHHILGRIGKHLLNPFEIVICSRDEHFLEQSHMSFERKQELLAIVRPLRIAQGFCEEDYK